jgi:hypothetical protein
MDERESVERIVAAFKAIGEDEIYVGVLGNPLRIQIENEARTVSEILQSSVIAWAFRLHPAATAEVLFAMANDLDPSAMDQTDVNFEFLCRMHKKLTP